jgi:uncharacterized phage protein (TIGR02218 family)
LGETMVELYKFTDGVTVYRYTSADSDIIYDGATWTAIPIGRGDRVRDTSEDTKNLLEVTVAQDNPVARLFLGRPPKGPVRFKLYRGETVETIALILTATVNSAQWSGSEATLECQSPMLVASRNGLRHRYQTQCRHALYSRGCGVDKTAFDLDYTFVGLELSGKRIRASTAIELVDGYAVGGILEIGGERRLILDHASILDGGSYDVYFDVMRPFSVAITAGDAVKAFAGCDHDVVTCREKFDNLANFGGFPVIPKVNPFDRRLTLPTD